MQTGHQKRNLVNYSRSRL